MDIRKRLISPCASGSAQDGVKVDRSGLVLRLLLFEKYIFQSIGLREFPEIVKAFGYGPVRTLLTSKAIDIHCEQLTTAQIGQFECPRRHEKGFLPYGSYSPTYVTSVSRDEYVRESLQHLNGIKGILKKEVIKLKQNVVACLLRPNPAVPDEMMRQFKADLRSNVPTIKSAIAHVLKERLKTEVKPTDFSIHIHQIDDEDFRTESNISDVFHLNQQEVHQIVEKGILAIGGLNQRIAEMKAFSALSGFMSGELPLFEQKLDFLSQTLSPDIQESRFKRVHVLAGFQDLDDLIERGGVDLHKLLEIRETRECKEFRDWLWSIDSITDEEMEDRIRSLREKLSWFAHAKRGKTIRWLASTGAGLIPGVGNVAGAVAGFLDTFLLEKVLSHPGPITFLSRLYPAIYKADPMITPANYLSESRK